MTRALSRETGAGESSGAARDSDSSRVRGMHLVRWPRTPRIPAGIREKQAMFGTKTAGISIATAFVAAIGTSGAIAQVANVGDRPSYTWKEPMLNGQGVKSLADLQGRPVLFDFWATY